MKITEAEWTVLDILWSGQRFALGELTNALKPVNGWSKNTVHTYLTRMEAKGLVAIDHSQPRPYAAAVSREDCARQERDDLLKRVYGGAAGDLVAAFLQESRLSPQERERLRKLLDEMEV
ncbi:MAG: BlaI/MecI/CopY family transcriptional regulator [Clostridiales bacterium]|nr:BlaI/MecI/CopY family transcriptional regulator [Clostridiales bacterium]